MSLTKHFSFWFALTFALVTAPRIASAQLTERLNSEAIREYLVLDTQVSLSSPTTPAMVYSTNQRSQNQLTPALPVPEKLILRTGHNVKLLTSFVNPLLYDYEAKVSTQQDPQNASLTKLLEACVSLLQTVDAKAVAAGASSTSLLAPPGDSFKQALLQLKSAQLLDLVQALEAELCMAGQAVKIVPLLQAVQTKAGDAASQAATLLQGAATATTRADLLAICANRATALKQLDESVKEVKKAADDVTTALALLPEGSTTGCSLAKLRANAYWQTYLAQFEVEQTARLALATALTELLNNLAPKVADNAVVKIGSGEYTIIRDIAVGSGEEVTLETTRTVLTPAITGNKLVVSRGAVRTSKVIFYRRGVALDLSTGAVFTNVTYVTYGTTTNAAGKMVVASPVEKAARVLTPVMLNVYPYLNLGPFYPLLQIGVAPTRERPAILGGIGVRLIGSKHFILSGGGVLTWQRELDGLAPGDVVTGTADIEEKTIFTFGSKVGGYIGLGYAF